MGLFGKKRSSGTTGESPVDLYWADEDVIEAPRVDTDDYKRIKRKRVLLRAWVWVSLALVPIMALVSIVIIGNLIGEEETADVTVDSPQKARAILEVERWLKTDPEPVPGGELLSWNSVEALPNPELDDSEQMKELPLVEVHRLTVASGSGAVFDVEVQTATSTTEGTSILAGPSLIPQAPAGDSASGTNPWPTLKTTSVQPAGEAAVAAWAQAFTSGDPDQLRIAVGDPNADSSYVPLAGAQVESITLRKAGIRETVTEGEKEVPELITAQVRLVIRWVPTEEPGQTPEPTENPASTGEERAEEQYTDYDVLISGASTASPRVVAWGGPGSGLWLEPYSNALIGRALTANDTDADTYSDPNATDPAGDPDASAPAESPESEGSEESEKTDEGSADEGEPEVENNTED